MAAQKAKSGSSSTLLMIVAFVAILGFLVYLFQQSANSVVEVAQEEAAPELAAGATAVSFADLAANPGNYVGQRVQVSGLPVVSAVAKVGFWAETPTGSYFLVHDPAMSAVVSGTSATVVGTVGAVDEPLLDGWQGAGLIENDGQRSELSFATHYIAAESVTFEGAAPAEAGAPPAAN